MKRYTLEEAIKTIELEEKKEVISIARISDNTFYYCLENGLKIQVVELTGEENIQLNHSPEY